MSKPRGSMQELGKNPRKRSPTANPNRSPTADPNRSPTADPNRSPTADPNRSRPPISNIDSKELYSYTPNWITPQEKARLKARVQRIKMNERRLTVKEEVLLLRASKKGSQDSNVDRKSPSVKGKAKKSSTTSEGATDAEDVKLKKTKSNKSVKSDTSKSKVSDKSSKESLKKAKSRDSVKSSKSDKGKSKEDLKMSKKHEDSHDKRKEAHANPSGNTMEKKPQREVSSTNLDEHLWATEYAHFDPQLYHFKSPEKLSTKNPVMAECPPFWVLLDHTIAVTWKLFSPEAERKDLGIIPLQWCREFVSAMRDERGEYLPATGQLLSAIEDALIDRYAKTSSVDEKEKTEKDDKRDCGNRPCKTDQDSLSYVSSENIFKYPIEVSYTLKDIMSRNMPGRKPTEGEEGGVQCKVEPVVNKIDVPPPDEHETMSKSDMLAYLKQLKQEQDMRVQNEKEHAEKIDALMELLSRGKIIGDPWVESKKKHDGEHVRFNRDQQQEDEDEEMSVPDDGKGKGGKEQKRKEEKIPKKEDKKKKVNLEESSKGKKGKETKRKKSESSLSSRSSTQ